MARTRKVNTPKLSSNPLGKVMLIGVLILAVLILMQQEKQETKTQPSHTKTSYTAPPNKGKTISKEYVAWAHSFLSNLLRKHPHPDINETLISQLKQGIVRLTISPHFKGAAKVDLLDTGVIEITVNCDYLLEHPREVQHSLLFHEYIHVKQALKKLITPFPSNPEEYVPPEPEIKMIRRGFEAEQEAYLEECKFSIAQQHSPLKPHCNLWKREQDEQKFRAFIANHLIHKDPNYNPYQRIIRETWVDDPKRLQDLGTL